jgi:hypothetical protein
MAVECARCKAQNADGKKFCGDCGASLDPAAAAANSALRDQVQEILAQRYKDQKVVEIETTQAIVARLLDWAKLLAFFVGIPIGVLLLIFGVLGFNTYKDFTTRVETAKTHVDAQLTAAQTGADKLKAEGEIISATYAELRNRLTDLQTIETQVRALTDQVRTINVKLGFTEDSKVTPELKSELEGAFPKFLSYLEGVGFPSTKDRVEVEIPDKMKDDMISYYDPDTKKLVIDKKYAADPSLLFHEFMHHALLRGKSPDGSDKNWAYYSIEAGLADYFPCSYIGKPVIGETAAILTHDPSFSQTIAQYRSFKRLKPKAEAAYSNGEIWANAFWELREVLGQPVADKVPDQSAKDKALDGSIADKLLYQAWLKLDPNAIRADKGLSFVRLLIDSDPGHQTQIRAVFAKRGLTP